MEPRTTQRLFVFSSRAILLFLLLMGVFSKRGWLDWRRMVRQNAHLDTRITLADSEKKSLERQILALETNPRVQERMVRKVLGYVKANESVIDLN